MPRDKPVIISDLDEDTDRYADNTVEEVHFQEKEKEEMRV